MTSFLKSLTFLPADQIRPVGPKTGIETGGARAGQANAWLVAQTIFTV